MSRVVIKLLALMRTELDTLKRYCNYYSVDEENIRLVLFTISQIQSLVIHLCYEVSSDNQLRVGPSARDKVSNLVKLELINVECFNSLCIFIDLRNISIHDYKNINKDSLIDTCKDNWWAYDSLISSLYRVYNPTSRGITNLQKSNLF